MRKKWFSFLMFSTLALVLILSLISAGCGPGAPKHARFVSSPWSGNLFQTWLPIVLLQDELGYTTDFKLAGVAANWAALAADEGDVVMGVWYPNQLGYKEEYIEPADGTIVELGIMYDNAAQGYWVPKAMYDQGIKSIPDLKDPKLAKSVDIDGNGKGDLLGCTPEEKCAQQNDECLALYGLDDLYEQKVGEEMLIATQMIARMQKDEPVLFYKYVPHIMFLNYPAGEDVMLLEDPQNFWGEPARIVKIANKNWAENNEQAADLISQIEVGLADINWFMAEVQETGDDDAALEALTRGWLEEHKAEVDSWVAAVK